MAEDKRDIKTYANFKAATLGINYKLITNWRNKLKLGSSYYMGMGNHLGVLLASA